MSFSSLIKTAGTDFVASSAIDDKGAKSLCDARIAALCNCCRTSQHVECVKFLLEKGADPCSETENGENCLHMAAKNGYTECMNEILQASVVIGTAEPQRLADIVLPYSTPVKFVDLRNSEPPCRFEMHCEKAFGLHAHM